MEWRNLGANWKKVGLGALALTLLIHFAFKKIDWRSDMSANSRQLTIITDSYWGRLSPVMQSTSMADALIGNVFEPLVDLDPRGGIMAGAADRWELSSDDRSIRFHIRPGMRFSDGTLLTAELYKKALLDSVSASDKDSHNPNAMDVLYRLKGFSIEAAKKSQVPGLRAESEDLIFEFDAPFRTAIFELSGTRYASWIRNSQGEWLGTGPYRIIEHVEGEKVIYEPNPFAKNKPTYAQVRVLSEPLGLEGLCRDKGDVYAGYTFPAPQSEGEKNCAAAGVKFTGGGIGGHVLLALNGKPGKLFADAGLRRAMQYAVHQVLPKVFARAYGQQIYVMDPQYVPPLWMGRLDESEAQKLIDAGKSDLNRLIEATKAHPIKLLAARPATRFIQEGLEKIGIQFERDFHLEPLKTVLGAIYGRTDYDMNAHGAGVLGNDPDGLYALLGKAGCLASEETRRPKVTKSMEEARSLHRTDDLDSAYKAASRSILEEVPEVHLAFDRDGYHFNSKKVSFSGNALNSDRFKFDSFIKLN